MTREEILAEIQRLVGKWKDKRPAKNTSLYWSYRADQNYYIGLRSKLRKLKNEAKTAT